MTNINIASPFSKILVGIDQSENSNRTFEYAVRLSKLSSAKLYLVYVIEILATAGSFVGVSDLEKYLEEEAHKLLDRIVKGVANQFNPRENIENVERIIKKGHPSKIILDLSKSIGADLIVVGNRGLGNVKEFLLGSVSHATDRGRTSSR